VKVRSIYCSVESARTLSFRVARRAGAQCVSIWRWERRAVWDDSQTALEDKRVELQLALLG
jgi:hypothetical protein